MDRLVSHHQPQQHLGCRSDRGAHGVEESLRILNEESLFAPVDAERPLGAVLQTVMRRAAAAEQLAVPPVARLQLLTRRGALTACFTVLVAISVVNAADAPPW